MPNTLKELETIELTEENIESMVYFIRGQKVMLDFDLARIYGYSTKAFNQQTKRNLNKFPEDFMFQLTAEEVNAISRNKKSTLDNDIDMLKTEKTLNESEKLMRSQNVTPQIWNTSNTGGRTYLPYAFTEQGIYMLMTVLKGELAIKQSIALIRLFKQMKDYISENRSLLNVDSALINNKFSSYDI